MKKLFYTIIIACMAISITSCKDALDLPPEDYFGEGNYWETESQVVNNMEALHSRFRTHMFTFFRLGEMRGGGLTDEAIFPVSLNETNIINQELSEASPGITSWAGFYNSILQVNLFIHKVSEADFVADEKKSYLLGQAHAIRAYYYFHLLRTYGGVPLRLTPDITTNKPDAIELRLERAKEEDVLKAIKTDVNTALDYFGGQASQDKSTWNPDAAKMLKGEVYLWSAKVYNQPEDILTAKTALESITGYSLLSEFSEIFDTRKNDEIIFSIHHKYREAEMGSSAAFLYDNSNFVDLYYKDTLDVTADPLGDVLQLAQSSAQPIQRYRYAYELFESYDIADQRREATFYDFYSLDRTSSPQKVTAKNTVLVKFLGEINNNIRHYTNDWPVYREADRLLLLAEITNLQNGNPSSYIKQIRDRAYKNVDPTPFVNGSQEDNEIAIFEERMKEFVFEGKRWYDLRRMQVLGTPLAFKSGTHPYGVLDESSESYKLLWPIERGIWTDDPLVDQTPGYQTTKP